MKKKIEKKKYYRSWTLSDELWERVKGEIPKRKRDTNKEYKNKPGQGRNIRTNPVREESRYRPEKFQRGYCMF